MPNIKDYSDQIYFTDLYKVEPFNSFKPIYILFCFLCNKIKSIH